MGGRQTETEIRREHEQWWQEKVAVDGLQGTIVAAACCDFKPAAAFYKLHGASKSNNRSLQTQSRTHTHTHTLDSHSNESNGIVTPVTFVGLLANDETN